MSSTKLEITLDDEIIVKAAKACALLDLKDLSEYIAMLIDKDASKVIIQHENITVEADVFDRFMSACEESHKPNKALVDAFSLTKKKGIS